MSVRSTKETVLGFAARLRSMYRGLMHRTNVEHDMRDEFEHHLAERADHLVRLGMAPRDAQQQARREFGHMDTHRANAREALGLKSITRLQFSWIDVKLGVRMLVKYPVLNLAAVFALAIGIPVGLAPTHLARALEAPLPGDADNRVRAIRFWDPLSSSVIPTSTDDFKYWSENLRRFSSIGSFRTSSFNVSRAGEKAVLADGAHVSSAVFEILGAHAETGRVLGASDFAPDAPDVVVIGHGLWSSRFGQDANVLNKDLRIGRKLYKIVGVMPDGFAFPSDESLWIPLRISSTSGSEEKSPVQIVGRLADGVSAAQAQAELSLKRLPESSSSPVDDREMRARVRAEVVPFGLLYLSLPSGGLEALPEFLYVQALMVVILLVACGNVAMLVFARTATRLREIAIRTSLGASRARIVSQIFTETFILAVVAAGIGIVVFDWLLRHVNIASLAGETQLPYWLSLGLTKTTALSGLLFAIVSATVAGVVPAVVITGRSSAQHMRGGSRLRFGRLTGALVVADIAVSVAAVGMAFAISGHATDLQAANRASGLVASEYLMAEFRLSDGDDQQTRRAKTQLDLASALKREASIKQVTFGDALPRMEHRSRAFEIAGIERAKNAPLRWTRTARVDVDYFSALETPILSGRNFSSADATENTRVAIVNSAFVKRVFGGRDPIGERVRFHAQSESADNAWYQIVGVVGQLGVNIVNPDHGEAVYLPAEPGTINPLRVAIHTSAMPATMVSRIREVSATVDPEIVMAKAAVLSDVRQGDWYLVMGLAAGLIALVVVLIALATTGLYAMLSLSVTERTREIGIRSALGATRTSLLTAVLKRSLVQIGLGAAIGLPLAIRFAFELTASTGSSSVVQSVAIALGLSVSLVAFVVVSSCLVPTRRILSVQASEAMRADG